MIDHWDPTPSYRQLASILRTRITSGEYGPGTQLPSEKHLTDESGLARETVRRAIKLLRDEGLVVTLPGRGTFVPPDHHRRPTIPTQVARTAEPTPDPHPHPAPMPDPHPDHRPGAQPR
ncbi:winged helix-turn-helix domain-containing protein [Phytoactinopolyspora limicola]|uniref:winged helix-turn-helix domain-containing protein n=1 Tax=Phytoactinopolyspora limicola TaxID=2715536 RepID=UPI001A9C385A|nr:winged helix-turn-helix domain-containing protein [Phytoactinopolyspora limicola]